MLLRIDAHRRRDLPIDRLHGLPLDPDKAGTQDLVPCDRVVPGRAEAIGVEAVERDGELVDVKPGFWRIERVEQHAVLHRRQRIQVLDLAAVEAIELILGQTGERYVGRRQRTGRHAKAMVDGRLQRLAIGLYQRGDGVMPVASGAEADRQREHAAGHLSIDRDPVAKRRFGRDGLAR